MGSGGLAATAIMEAQFKENMTEAEAKQVCINAIEAGIYNDEGSGSNVDVCVITRKGGTVYRNIKSDNFKIFSKPGGYKFKPERVEVLKTYNHPVVVEDGGQPMEM
jgi:20S proteasome subunit beta 2